MTDLQLLCLRMADELDHYRQLLSDDRREVHCLAVEARAAVAAAADGPAVPESREPASVAVEVRPLRPAAAALVEAFDDRYENCGPFDDWQEVCLAAALRHLAAAHGDPESFGAVRPERLEQLAAELEGQS